VTEQYITPYHTMPGFEHVYLEDSYVTEIIESSGRLEFALELVLLEGHPLYAPTAPGEQHCYRPARLVVPDVRQVVWIERHIRPFKDAADQVDYGNIDAMYERDGLYHLEGDWGIVEVASGPPQLLVDDGSGGGDGPPAPHS
jgi:hypothetical protein